MKVIAVVGTKKTGKTTLVTALIKSLVKYGRVGTIKNMAGHPVDHGDTQRHFDAGAEEVIGLGENQLKVTMKGSLESALAELQKDGMDFVIVEGFKHSGLPKIVLGDIDVPNMLHRVALSDLNDALIDNLIETILGLNDYEAETGCIEKNC
ncbi:MAG: molybdopterin-guanine dinucleotide biosynthesis protein B [Methanotrichaceae archaeon]